MLSNVDSAYLFCAGVTQSQIRPSRTGHGETLQTWDSCLTAIFYGGELDEARKRFEDWCQLSPEGQHPVETRLKQVLVAPCLGQLLTESGERPVDWPEISRRIMDTLSTTAVDDFEQGYWVDVNQLVPPGSQAWDIESLKSDLPEDIRSGLNWSSDKNFVFLVSALNPPPPPPDPDAEFDHLETVPGDAAEESSGPAGTDLDPAVASLPELREKQGAALVEARNSVVAGWLWRKYAARTFSAETEIHVGQCCSVFPVQTPR